MVLNSVDQSESASKCPERKSQHAADQLCGEIALLEGARERNETGIRR